MNSKIERSTVAGSVLHKVSDALPTQREVASQGTTDTKDALREEAMLEAMAGHQTTLAGIPLRPFCLADYAMLRRCGSHFVNAEENQVESNQLEGMILFLYVMDAKRTLEETVDIAYSNAREEVLRMAIIEMGPRLPNDQDISKLYRDIIQFIASARGTRTEVVPDKQRRTAKGKKK